MANYWKKDEQKKKRQEKKEQTNKALEYVLGTFQLPPDIAKALANAIVGERGESENTKIYKEFNRLVREQIEKIMAECPKEGYAIFEIVEKIPFEVSSQKVSQIAYRMRFNKKWGIRTATRTYSYTLPDGRTCTKNRKVEVLYKK